MNWKSVLAAAALLFLIIPSLYSDFGSGQSANIKQVMVTAERASIYIEPSRSSTRIDIVGKGTLLNLLQTKKVKDIWYYVSFSSSRYGTRVSGFVLDSAVELFDAAIPPVSEPKKAPEKAEPRPPIPPPAAATPAKEEAKPDPQPPPKVKAKLEPPVPPEWSEALVFTQIPRSKRYSSPLKTAPLQEMSWKVEEPAPVEEEKTPLKAEERTVLTSLPKQRKIALPKKERPLQDAAWQVIPPAAEIPKKPEKVEAAPQPDKKKKRNPAKSHLLR